MTGGGQPGGTQGQGTFGGMEGEKGGIRGEK